MPKLGTLSPSMSYHISFYCCCHLSTYLPQGRKVSVLPSFHAWVDLVTRLIELKCFLGPFITSGLFVLFVYLKKILLHISYTFSFEIVFLKYNFSPCMYTMSVLSRICYCHFSCLFAYSFYHHVPAFHSQISLNLFVPYFYINIC